MEETYPHDKKQKKMEASGEKSARKLRLLIILIWKCRACNLNWASDSLLIRLESLVT